MQQREMIKQNNKKWEVKRAQTRHAFEFCSNFFFFFITVRLLSVQKPVKASGVIWSRVLRFAFDDIETTGNTFSCMSNYRNNRHPKRECRRRRINSLMRPNQWKCGKGDQWKYLIEETNMATVPQRQHKKKKWCWCNKHTRVTGLDEQRTRHQGVH